VLTLVLLGRLVLSVGASAWQKRLLTAGVPALTLWRRTYAWMVLPALALMLTGQPAQWPRAFWISAVLAGGVDAAGNLALAAALRRTDLSVFGPLNAFRPVFALGVAWVLLGERPAPAGWLGVAILVVGAGWLLRGADPAAPPGARRTDWPALAWRFGGLALSTVSAAFQKQALGLGPLPATLGVWILSGAAGLWLGRRLLREPAGPDLPPAAARELAGHAAVFLGMQALTLLVFRGTLLTYAFAFFQLAMGLQVLLGHWWLGEPHPGRRLAACGLMGLGALVILRAG
jgi:drug/metabolite transporter (DMT)-like permease